MLATLLCAAVSTSCCVTGAGGLLRPSQGQRDVSRGVVMRLRVAVRVCGGTRIAMVNDDAWVQPTSRERCVDGLKVMINGGEDLEQSMSSSI